MVDQTCQVGHKPHHMYILNNDALHHFTKLSQTQEPHTIRFGSSSKVMVTCVRQSSGRSVYIAARRRGRTLWHIAAIFSNIREKCVYRSQAARSHLLILDAVEVVSSPASAEPGKPLSAAGPVTGLRLL